MIYEPRRREGELAAQFALKMGVVAPPGETWDAEGNREAIVRTRRGLTTYSERNSRVSKPKPKKRHTRFTAPAPDVSEESLRAYQDALEVLQDNALPEAAGDLMEPPPSNSTPVEDGVQDCHDVPTVSMGTASSESRDSLPDFQESSKILVDPAPSEIPQASTAQLEVRQEKQERQATPQPEEPAQDPERQYRWAKFGRVGGDYFPTARELAKVITVPKRPSKLRHCSTPPPPSPPKQPSDQPVAPAGPSDTNPQTPSPTTKTQLPKQTAPNSASTDPTEEMDTLNALPARLHPLPRPSDPDLRLTHSQTPLSEQNVEIIDWKISPSLRDISYLLKLTESLSAPL